MLARFTSEEGTEVSYKPLSGSAVSVQALAGQQRAASSPVQSSPTTQVIYSERDFFIRVSDWTAAGLSGNPARGDRITETVNGTAKTYEVTSPIGEPWWTWAEEEQYVLRIHTKPVVP